MTVDSSARFSTGELLFGSRKLKTLVLENDLVRVSVVPERGGRIAEWWDKRDGVNVLSLPDDARAENYGGLLDDHMWVEQSVNNSLLEFNYVYNLKSTGPEVVALELWPFEQHHYRREILLRRGQPGIEVRYTFDNIFQEDGGNTLVRNVIWPRGRPEPEDWRYVTPLAEGIVVGSAPVGNDAVFGAPWRAALSLRDQRAVAFAFSNELFQGGSDWAGSHTRPTFEWFYRDVPKGKSASTKVWAWIVHGFSRLAHVGETFVADLEPRNVDGGIEVGWAFATTDPDLKEAVLTTLLLDLDGHEIARLEAVALRDLEVDRRQAGVLTWRGTGQPLLVRQEVRIPGYRSAEVVEVPWNLPAGHEYRRRPTFSEPLEFTDLPGWKPKMMTEVVTTEEDRQRGYLVYASEGQLHQTQLTGIHLDLAQDEYESMELRFMALNDLGGRIGLEVEMPSGWQPGSICVSATERRTTEIWGKQMEGWKLSEQPYFAVEPGAPDPRIWLIVHAAALPPGDYSGALVFIPEKGPRCVLPLFLKVWALRLPRDRHFHLDPNTPLDELGLKPSADGGAASRGKSDRPASSGTKPPLDELCLTKDGDACVPFRWNTDRTARYADDLAAHGARRIRAYGRNTAPGQNYAGMRLRASGELLTAALLRDPRMPERESPPALDLSFWDPWLQVWIDRGFTYYETYLDRGGGTYFERDRELAERVGADPQKLRRWLSAETARYLKERGFRHVHAVLDDEIAADRFPEWIKAADDARALGWLPGVTISDSFFQNQELYELAAPHMDLWAVGDPNALSIAKAKRDGFMKARDYIGSYDGWGTFFREYSHMRASLWRRALAGTDVFWVQCYIRRPLESIVFDEDGRPWSSGAWEGLRDGAEDANFIRAAMSLMTLVEKAGKADEAQDFRQRLERIAGSVDQGDAATIRAARCGIFELLLDMRQTVPPVRPSLFWHDLPIIKEGQPCFALFADTGGCEAAKEFQCSVRVKTGIEIEFLAGKAPERDAIVFGHPKDGGYLGRIAENFDLGMTSCYPAPESYLIRDISDRRQIAILGRGVGLFTGARNFFNFLRLNPEYPDQYFSDYMG